MSDELVERIWDGPFDALLPNMSVLRRGETHLVTEEQAKSGHWKDPLEKDAPTAFSTTFNTPALAPAPAAAPAGGTD